MQLSAAVELVLSVKVVPATCRATKMSLGLCQTGRFSTRFQKMPAQRKTFIDGKKILDSD